MQYSAVVLALAATVYAQSQISDGQVQAPTGVVSQLTDGQVQAPTGAVVAPVTQITDGQIQAPTGAASQITDGQIQVPTAAASQITDGQVQAPPAASTGMPVPSSNGTVSTPAPKAFTGAASAVSWSKEAAIAVIGAAFGFALL